MCLFARGLCLVAAAAICAALGTAPARAADDELDYSAGQRMAAGHRFADKVDKGSFAAAVAPYPRTKPGESYDVAVGRYMMWRLIGLFSADAGVGELSLTDYKHRCWTIAPEKEPPKVICGVSARIHVVVDGASLILVYRNPGQGVGKFADASVPANAPKIRAGMRGLVDKVVAGFRDLLVKRGVLAVR